MRKTSIFGHFGTKWTILDNFWPKWDKREFFSKQHLEDFFALTSPNLLQSFRKINEGIPIKVRKTSIFGQFGPKWTIFDTSWPKWANWEFF